MSTLQTMPLHHWIMDGLIAVIIGAIATDTLAAPCADFTDVDDAVVGADFCQSVEWIKNRAVTAGCSSATLYCPGSAVSRLQMAAFMNRLGNALTPVHLPLDASPGAIDLDPGIVVCQTQEFEVEDFPRRAYADLTFNASAPADVSFAADLVMSLNDGASWTNLNAVPNRGFVSANRWGTLSDLAFADLAVGQKVRWGVRLTRGGIAGGADLSDSRCQLRVLVHSRKGAASPI